MIDCVLFEEDPVESGRPAGGLWIVQAEGAQAVRDLVEPDPYWPTGLRKSVRIYEWEQVFPSRP